MTERNQPSDFYFSPESKLWEMNREMAIPFFGGQRALLMQLAHPLVAQAVAEHSSFTQDTLTRLMHTRAIISSLIFGTEEEVQNSARAINHAHKSVSGEIKQDIGIHKAGNIYNARNPELLVWVWATLTDTSLLVFDKFVRPLADHEKEEYYQEIKRILPLLGGKPQQTPTSIKDFSEYMKDMVNNGNVVANQKARELAPYIMLQQFPHIKPFSLFMSQIVTGLLPENIRDQYGFGWNRPKQTLLDKTAAASRLLYPHIFPDKVRFFSTYRNAHKKMGS